MAQVSTLSNPSQRVFWLVFFYTFGVVNWFLHVFALIRSGRYFSSPSEQDQLRLAISRDQFWNLSKQPITGFHHAFFKLQNGLKLHYITNRQNSKGRDGERNGTGNLFILLHGFPDSTMMWRHILKEPSIPSNSARIVCLDLPNFGGSDTFNNPDTAVLEAIAEFVIAMREEHEQAASESNTDFSTVIVGHDWGCVIAYRLAAEAPQLADRFVLSNGPHVGLSLNNVNRVVSSASKIFKQFRESPRQNIGCLRKSFDVAKPLVRQVIMFNYMFIFHLPKIMVTHLGTCAQFGWLQAISRAAHGKHKEEHNPQQSLAATLGPGVIEVETQTISGETYGKSVHVRAASPGEAWWHQTAYYRNHLATQKWEKSLETIAELYNIESERSASASISPMRRRSSSSASSTLFTEQYNGALRAPATILWGENDIAVTRAICLDGIGDYLALSSEVISLPHTGHWVGVEKESRAALAHLINVCAAAGAELPSYMMKSVEEVYDGASVIAKR